MNDVWLQVLVSLSEGPKHGYSIQDDIEQITGHRLGPGSLYGAISRLEEQGLIEPLAPAGRRRPYRITSHGRGRLAASVGELRRLVAHADLRLATQ